MANYSAAARTNRFLVKDVEALKNDLARYGLVSTTPDEPFDGDLIIASGDGRPENEIVIFSEGGWPSFDEETTAARLDFDDVSDEDWVQLGLEETSLSSIIASHLEENEVAIFVEVGHERLRSLSGVAVAVNAAGEKRRVDLDDILDLAAELTVEGHTIKPPHS